MIGGKCFIEEVNKHPKGTKENRVYYDKPSSKWSSYCACYDPPYFKLDIDDYDKAGNLKNPIKGEPRSEAIMDMLDAEGLKYNACETRYGIHIYMKLLPGLIEHNKINWYTPVGIVCEWKLPTSGDHIVIKRDGKPLHWIKGHFDNGNVDELPYWLYPLRGVKGRAGTLELNLEDGEGRTNALNAHMFSLVRAGYTPEQTFKIMHLINDFCMDEPLREIDSSVLNEKTFEKLTREYEQLGKSKKGLTPEVFKTFLEERGILIRFNESTLKMEFHNLPVEYQTASEQDSVPIKMTYDLMEYTGIRKIHKQQVIDLMFLEGVENSFNPVQNYFITAGENPQDHFKALYSILGIEDEFLQMLVKKWMVQTVAMAFNTLENPYGAEGVLILSGPEACGKTRFFQLLCPKTKWFTSRSTEIRLHNKDDQLNVLGFLITEIAECDTTLNMANSTIKGFITDVEDTLRIPYAKQQETAPRHTSFCGTTNEEKFLNKKTGFRRWWHVPVTKIKNDEFLSREELKALWGYCYTLYQADENYFRLTEDELSELERRNLSITSDLPRDLRIIYERLDFETPINEWKWITAGELCKEAFDNNDISPRSIGKRLTELKKYYPEIESKTRDGYRKYWLPPVKKSQVD
ncbi:hypothetical protein EUCA11A_18940 [Eubacterium callanderi]|uniref:VapE domain-containing protein n=1 Tax=Eubacterium callanderi TaxID=53442 RepID=UPI0029FF2E27|nr:VapE domain-containing protein [Eubacterium callanderi]WPK67722.1 hypothetical protein EUCA2A_18940 [Eubacterium callanderi]WPK72020.1 hypothetical protein EUCA11A_18940 [Eubacterium callanderi]